MNNEQRKQAASEAAEMIASGVSLEALVHVLFYPSECAWSEEEIQGLSTPLNPGSNLSGYTSRYYTLEELALMP